MGFFRRSRVAYSVVCDPIWSKFLIIKDYMHALITSKFEKNQINSNREKVVTSILSAPGQLTPESVVVSGRNAISSNGRFAERIF